MLDELFRRHHHVRRLRANPLGARFDPLTELLFRRGHGPGLIHQYLRALEHFGHWLGACHPVVAVDQVTTASVRQFLQEHLPHCSCTAVSPRECATNLAAPRHLLRMLAQQGPSRLPPPSPHDALLAQYDHFLRQTCGLSEHALVYRMRNARTFLQRQFGHGPPHLGRLRPADLQDYFRRHAGHLKPGSAAVLATSLRDFLHSLALTQGADPALATAVPAAPQWPQERLPRSLSDRALRAALAHFDARTATGRRDLATMRCTSDLGPRVSEVVALTLGDIDWRRGVLAIRGGKGRRGRTLALPTPAGRAITAYLHHGRPTSADRHVFLRRQAPVAAPVTHTSIRGVFRRAYAAATGRTESVGTHVLRHTAAARTRAAGQSLKGIADVLGHRCLDTTTTYVKVDVEALRDAAYCLIRKKRPVIERDWEVGLYLVPDEKRTLKDLKAVFRGKRFSLTIARRSS
jgi:site-specific recombinase XerD